MGMEPTTRHLVVTGGSGGIGRALVEYFAGKGFSVAAIGRNQDALDALSEAEGNVAGIAGDVSDPEQCSRVFEQATETFGPPTDLIAAAAVYPKAFFLDQDAAHLDDVLRINVTGVANTVRAVLPAMLESNFGRIVVVGSLADMTPVPGSLAYSVSKGALHTLVRAIDREIDKDRYPNVLINEFSPGATKTAMSTYGNDPVDIPPMLEPLLMCGPDGPHGRFFQERREIRIGESWKGAIKRVLLRRGS